MIITAILSIIALIKINRYSYDVNSFSLEGTWELIKNTNYTLTNGNLKKVSNSKMIFKNKSKVSNVNLISGTEEWTINGKNYTNKLLGSFEKNYGGNFYAQENEGKSKNTSIINYKIDFVKNNIKIGNVNVKKGDIKVLGWVVNTSKTTNSDMPDNQVFTQYMRKVK
jgi:hypothetical protein